MDFAIEVKEKQNFIRIDLFSPLTLQISKDIITREDTVANIRKNMNVILNLEDSTLRMSPADLESVADLLKSKRDSKGSRYKIAMVVNNDLAFGMSRMFSVLAEQIPAQVGVMENLEDAERWLAT